MPRSSRTCIGELKKNCNIEIKDEERGRIIMNFIRQSRSARCFSFSMKCKALRLDYANLLAYEIEEGVATRVDRFPTGNGKLRLQESSRLRRSKRDEVTADPSGTPMSRSRTRTHGTTGEPQRLSPLALPFCVRRPTLLGID